MYTNFHTNSNPSYPFQVINYYPYVDFNSQQVLQPAYVNTQNLQLAAIGHVSHPILNSKETNVTSVIGTKLNSQSMIFNTPTIDFAKTISNTEANDETSITSVTDADYHFDMSDKSGNETPFKINARLQFFIEIGDREKFLLEVKNFNKLGFKYSLETYKLLMHFYRENKEEIDKLINDLSHDKLKLDFDILTFLIQHHGCNDRNSIKKFIEEIHSKFIFDREIYKNLINLYRLEDPEYAIKIYQMMIQKGVKPDTGVISIMTTVFKCYDYKFFINFFNDLEKYKIKPTINTFQYIIDFELENNNFNQALMRLKELKKLNMKPKTELSINYIKNICRTKDQKLMIEYLMEMKELKDRLNGKCYEMLIEFFIDINELNPIDKLLDVLQTNKIFVSPTEFKNLIALYNNNPEITFSINKNFEIIAEKKIKEVKDVPIGDTLLAFTSANNLFTNCSETNLNYLYRFFMSIYDIDNAKKAIEKIKEIAFPLEITYNTLMHFYMEENDEFKGNEILNKLENSYLKIHSETAFNLFKFYSHFGKIDKLIYLISKFESNCIDLPSLYTSLLKFYYKNYDSLDIKKYKSIIFDKISNSLQSYLDNQSKASINYHDIPWIKLISCLIDYHVCVEEFDKSNNLMNKYGVAPTNLKNTLLDLHGLSHGAAYMCVRNWLRTCKEKTMLCIITGKGIHSHTEPFAMKNYIIKMLKIYHSDFSINENKASDAGYINLIKWSVKASEFIPQNLSVVDNTKKN